MRDDNGLASASRQHKQSPCAIIRLSYLCPILEARIKDSTEISTITARELQILEPKACRAIPTKSGTANIHWYYNGDEYESNGIGLFCSPL